LVGKTKYRHMRGVRIIKANSWGHWLVGNIFVPIERATTAEPPTKTISAMNSPMILTFA
jgi:hypothetical protein